MAARYDSAVLRRAGDGVLEEVVDGSGDEKPRRWYRSISSLNLTATKIVREEAHSLHHADFGGARPPLSKKPWEYLERDDCLRKSIEVFCTFEKSHGPIWFGEFDGEDKLNISRIKEGSQFCLSLVPAEYSSDAESNLIGGQYYHGYLFGNEEQCGTDGEQEKTVAQIALPSEKFDIFWRQLDGLDAEGLRIELIIPCFEYYLEGFVPRPLSQGVALESAGYCFMGSFSFSYVATSASSFESKEAGLGVDPSVAINEQTEWLKGVVDAAKNEFSVILKYSVGTVFFVFFSSVLVNWLF